MKTAAQMYATTAYHKDINAAVAEVVNNCETEAKQGNFHAFAYVKRRLYDDVGAKLKKLGYACTCGSQEIQKIHGDEYLSMRIAWGKE